MPRIPIREPIELTATWRTRFWTTTPPRYDPHTEWALHLAIEASEPIRVAIVLVEGADARVRRDRGRGVVFEMALGRSTEEEPSRAELADPWTALGVSRPVDVQTWQRISVRAGSGSEPSVAVIVLARRDTDSLRNGRWRVRPDLVPLLGSELQVLRIASAST